MTLIYQPSDEVAEIELPSSKSISNRLLIAKALSNDQVQLVNLSAAQDTLALQNALSSNAEIIDVGMAGTAFRFLTAFYSLKADKVILTGTKRMKERPIGILVDELRSLGANISYQEKKGFPPLKILKSELKGGKISIDASVSSQYVSALLLIAPYLENGLELTLDGDVVSFPYIDLTINLQQLLSIEVYRKGNTIKVNHGSYSSEQEVVVESDWSSAAFFYQYVALSGKSLFIKNLNSKSLQGDVVCSTIFKSLGVETEFKNAGALLSFDSERVVDVLTLDMTETPDLIPSVAVTASQLVEKITIIGTKTLYIKECNRVEAMKNELLKVGSVLTEIDGNSIEIEGSRMKVQKDKTVFTAYGDHRMAMCLAPLAVYSDLIIDEKEVVEKSFPNFWKELEKVGIFN